MGTVLLVVSSGALVAVGVPDQQHGTRVAGVTAVAVAAALACLMRARRSESSAGRSVRAWRLLALGQAFSAAAALGALAGEPALVPVRMCEVITLGLTASAVFLLLPPSTLPGARRRIDGVVVVLSWAVVAETGPHTTVDLLSSAWVAQVLAAGLAVLVATGCTMLLARGAEDQALPLSALLPFAAAGLVLAGTEVVRAGVSGTAAQLIAAGVGTLVLIAACAPAWRAVPAERRDREASRAEHLAALAPYGATVPAAGAVLASTLALHALPAVTAVTVAGLGATWLLASLTARWEAVTTVRALRSRVDAETLARGMREKWFRSLVQSSTDVITVVDPEGWIRFQTPSAAHILGHEPTSLVGTRFGALMRPRDAERLGQALAVAAASPWSVTTVGFAVQRKDALWVDTETTITSLVSDPDIGGIVLNTRDVSERRQLEQQLARQAYSDSLTGLANRLFFRDRVEAALTAEHGNSGSVAVLFCDLNGFKAVNDTLGHATGDELLRLVAQRLRRCVRGEDLVARLGGDEFSVLVSGQDAEQAAVWLAGRVRTALASPFGLLGRDVAVSTSTGIAVSDSGTENAEQLLRNADLAMYRAKADHDLKYVRFERDMHEALLARVKVETDLRQAVARSELTMHYQPVVHLATGQIVGAEALVRWNHAERGLVLPGEFIPIAEETGLVAEIGAWALAEACQQAAGWQRYASTGQDFHVAVNMSARQVNPSTVSLVADLLARSDVPPRALTLEVTESALMAREDAASLLGQMKALGVRVAIDDFGTGYSSLSYLSRFPVDVIKIDQSFVADVGTFAGPASTGSVALARSIVNLGRSLQLTTVAEGIETAQQHAALAAMGCELGQGFYFSRPVTAEAFEALLALRDRERVATA
ncbi:MAG: putative bifunctional diguanylate cyclase/phosphodiesterase [Actinomycetes bacterium]